MGPEKSFENKVKKYIEDQGGWQVKFFANSFTKTGIPDILACVNSYFIAIEVKAENGKPSDLQLHQCKKIRKAGGFSFILYPSGFDNFKEFIFKIKKGYFDPDLPLIMKGGRK